MITTKEKTVQVTDKIYCDSCNSVCTHDNYGTTYSDEIRFCPYDYAEINVIWGYNSKLDGASYNIHLCENCFLDVIQLLQTKRKLWAKDDSNNPLYGSSLKYE